MIHALRIAWINKTLGNPVFDLGRRAALQRAAKPFLRLLLQPVLVAWALWATGA